MYGVYGMLFYDSYLGGRKCGRKWRVSLYFYYFFITMRLCYVLFNEFYVTFITLLTENVQSAVLHLVILMSMDE